MRAIRHVEVASDARIKSPHNKVERKYLAIVGVSGKLEIKMPDTIFFYDRPVLEKHREVAMGKTGQQFRFRNLLGKTESVHRRIVDTGDIDHSPHIDDFF